MKETVSVYEPNSRQKVGFFRSLFLIAKNIKNSRQLIWQLFLRDFLAVYKKSFLGVGWILISPIIGIASWVFMNMAGILKPGDVGIPYPAYVLLGTSIWGLFMGFYGSAVGTLSAGNGFIMQVKYPHEALFAKQILQHLATFFIGFLVIIFVLLAFGVFPSWKIIFFPLVIIPLFLLGSAMGLIVSVVAVVAVEVQKVVDTGLGFLIFLTPVLYAQDFINPYVVTIVDWNPLTYLVGASRDIIVQGRINNVEQYAYSTLFALVVFLIAWRLFYVSEEKVIEKMI